MTAARDVGTAVQAVVASVQGACADPADQVRMLLRLAGLPGTGPVAVRGRRAAVIALARASRVSNPASYQDALLLLDQVTGALDQEITAAGDAGQDAIYDALRRLRVAVVTDLTARGASLAPLIFYRSAAPLPALVVAHVLYRDATRADELIQRVQPVHPGFMPIGSLQVLAQ